MTELDSLLKFISFTNDFQRVYRHVLVKDESRQESDMEHSYQLAMAAWYIVSSRKLRLSLDTLLRYALVHDLVEVHAGDTYIYDPDQEVLNSKAAREAEALEKIKNDFPEFPELYEWIHAYEQKGDAESQFVYALDKILPMINIYLDGGRTWREEHVTLQMLIDHKTPRVAVSPEVVEYFNAFINLLHAKEAELF